MREIERSTTKPTFWGPSDTYATVVPKTEPYRKLQMEDAVFTLKLEDDPSAEEITRQYTEKPGTQLRLSISSNDPQANSMEAWHAVLIDNEGNKHPLKRSNEKAYSTTQTYVSSTGGYSYGGYTTPVSVYSYDITTYYGSATLSTDDQVDLTKDFRVLIEPRYKRGLNPVELEWLAPETA